MGFLENELGYKVNTALYRECYLSQGKEWIYY